MDIHIYIYTIFNAGPDRSTLQEYGSIISQVRLEKEVFLVLWCLE